MSSASSQIQFAIMAGGKSRRMGEDKAWLAVGGVPLICRVLQAVQSLGQGDPIIVTNTPEHYVQLGMKTIGDIQPDSGALGGIHAALTHAQSHEQLWVLVLACDMPFVSPDLLRYMLAKTQDTSAQAIVPVYDGHLHSLHALYHVDCLPTIASQLTTAQFAIRQLLDTVPVNHIPVESFSDPAIPSWALMNCNTPQDLDTARRIAATLLD